MVNGTVEVRLTQGDTMFIEVETDENLHNTEAIEIYVNENLLTVQDHNCRYTKMIVYVQFPATYKLKSLTANGTGLFETTNEISAIDGLFTVSFNGTRKGHLKLYSENGLQLTMNGTSELTISGIVHQWTNIEQSGTSKLDAEQCKMNHVTAVLQGVSTAYIVAQDEINVNVQGVSSVFYRGPLNQAYVGAITCKVQEF
ncbi:unnamed protein product [Rotaria socialis]|uniref:Putative auto-transporter adhesin head GIN domain-containing protein n=1 Tax=Rotaria socialis TaxID=392032 RepID=A0A818VMI3_9BILA|nr:unnamed protein product [Rotaria socialis]CAF4629880.1 unnamed protein product [Rotaria socialis]